jgi:hypothetical protein
VGAHLFIPKTFHTPAHHAKVGWAAQGYAIGPASHFNCVRIGNIDHPNFDTFHTAGTFGNKLGHLLGITGQRIINHGDTAHGKLPSETIKTGGYEVSRGYDAHLKALLDYHEQNNVLAAVKKHELIKGDVAKSAPKYFKKNRDTVVALAYFDMALYRPTKIALQAIRPNLIPGSVLILDEFNNRDYPGETLAFQEVFRGVRYEARKSKFMTDRTFIILK